MRRAVRELPCFASSNADRRISRSVHCRVLHAASDKAEREGESALGIVSAGVLHSPEEKSLCTSGECGRSWLPL